jgi:hypothetical protein
MKTELNKNEKLLTEQENPPITNVLLGDVASPKLKKETKMKFTFKTEKPTGRYRSFYRKNHDIKIKKKKVGSIVDREWKIRLMVLKSDINEDGNPNCEWKWITLKKESASLQEAKDWLNVNFISLNEKYKIVGVD